MRTADPVPTVFCFGDSNTYGYDPRSPLGERYPPEVRWTGLLSRDAGWRVLEAGQNGQEIPHRPPELAAVRRLTERCPPPEGAVLLLGSNDLLLHPSFTAEDAAARMEGCLAAFLERWPPAALLLTAPPPMVRGAWVAEERLVRESARLAACYRALARRLGVGFADAGAWGVDLAFDGVHFSPAGHRAFARGIREALAPLCG